MRNGKVDVTSTKKEKRRPQMPQEKTTKWALRPLTTFRRRPKTTKMKMRKWT